MDERYKQFHSALSQCAELLDNMKDGDPITEVPDFLAVKLKELSAHLAGQSQATRAVPDLHNAIMNLPALHAEDVYSTTALAYKCGHRDALHAAAELVNEAVAAQEVTQQAAPIQGIHYINEHGDRVELQILHGGPSAHGFEITVAAPAQQAAKAETAEQADLTTVDCIECGGSGEMFGSFACDECGGQGKLIVSRKDLADVAPTTSTVSAPEEVRNQALEDAAKVADGFYDHIRQYTTDVPAIGSAIRALRTTSGKGEAA